MRILSMNVLLLGFVFAVLGHGAQASSTPSDAKSISQAKPGEGAPTAAAAGDGPILSLPYTPGLDPEFMDRTADPCVDFYQYSCGGWMKKNPIPPDQPGWSVYAKLDQDNQRFLWGILDDLARNTSGRNPNQQKIGDYFAACMDEPAIEKLGATPLKPALEQINGLTSKKQLPALLAEIHLRTEGSGMFFGFGSSQDYGDSSQVIAFATAGGLGLPDRDYYTRSDPNSVALREKYVAHVQRMLELLETHPRGTTRIGDDHGDGDTAGGGFANSRRTARPAQALPQSRFGCIAGALAEFRLDRLPETKSDLAKKTHLT